MNTQQFIANVTGRYGWQATESEKWLTLTNETDRIDISLSRRLVIDTTDAMDIPGDLYMNCVLFAMVPLEMR